MPLMVSCLTMDTWNTTGHTVLYSVRRLLTLASRPFAAVRGRPRLHSIELSVAPIEPGPLHAARRRASGIEAGQPVSRLPVILVATQAEPDRDAALVGWCASLFRGAACLRIVHVLTIPMTSPLDVPLPQAEEEVRAGLARVARIAVMMGTDAETAVVRHRQPIGGLVEEARRTGAAAVAVRAGGWATPWVRYLLDRSMRRASAGAPCPVITVYLPEPRRLVGVRGAARTNGRMPDVWT